MTIHLEVAGSEVDGHSRRLTRLTEEGGAKSIEIFHEFNCLLPWSSGQVLDAYVLPILFHAMKKGGPLRVHGVLSRSFVRNIEELQSAWHCWKPDTYKKIEVIPDGVIDAEQTGNGRAIAAFSGGVDATFTAMRHALSSSPVRYHLTDVLMVHGFDVPLIRTGQFQQLSARVKPLIDELGLRLRTVRTNSREVLSPNWEDVFAVQLAGCLQMFSDEYSFGLIGSSEPYDSLIFPWGSNPVTDHLTSGDRMTVIHDGAAFSRTEKIAEIAKHPTASKTVKVGWVGKNQGSNCGVCEKCVRTKLNFLAVGSVVPECFDGPLDIGLIENLPVTNTPQLMELQSIVNYARKHGCDDEWLPALERRINKGVVPAKKTHSRKLAIRALKALGLKETVKNFLYKEG